MPTACPRARRRLPSLALLTLLLPFASAAADFAVGGAVGPSRGRVECVDGYPCDRAATGWKLTGTWYASPSVEVQVAGFGSTRFQGGDRTDLGTAFGGDFKVRGVGLTAGYRWSFAPDWSVVGRLGVAGVRTTFDYADPFSGSRGKSIAAPLGGIGIAYAVTPSIRIGLDYDETRFKAHRDRGALRMLGVAAEFSF